MSEEKEFQCPCPDDLPEYVGDCGNPELDINSIVELFNVPPPTGPLERLRKVMLRQAVNDTLTTK